MDNENLDTGNKNAEITPEGDEAAMEVWENGIEDLNLDTDDYDEVKEEQEEENELEDNQSDDDLEESEDEESEDEVESEEETSEEGDDEEYETIPEDQVQVARSLGLSDEEIVTLSPETLERMVERHRKEVSTSPRVEPKVEPKDVEKKDEIPLLDHQEFDVSELDPDLREFAAKLLEGQNKLIDERNKMAKKLNEVDEVKQSIQQRDAADFQSRVDSMFDELEEHLPEVGNTNSLDDRSQLLRNELFYISQGLAQTRGLSQQDAINEAAYMWKMAQIDPDEIERKATEGLKRKLNSNKKRMSPRPGGKKTKKKFKSADEAALDTLEKKLESVWEGD